MTSSGGGGEDCSCAWHPASRPACQSACHSANLPFCQSAPPCLVCCLRRTPESLFLHRPRSLLPRIQRTDAVAAQDTPALWWHSFLRCGSSTLRAAPRAAQTASSDTQGPGHPPLRGCARQGAAGKLPAARRARRISESRATRAVFRHLSADWARQRRRLPSCRAPRAHRMHHAEEQGSSNPGFASGTGTHTASVPRTRGR